MLKILIPTDGSAAALLAAQHALLLVSKGLHARFVVVNVQDPATLYEMVVAHDPEVLERVRCSSSTTFKRKANASA
ncbi:MAG: universal stress protein, partial [Burkholderiales bacterium]